MLTLMVPCRACKEDDLKATVKLLEECVGNKYPLGIEIVGPVEDFLDYALIARNIADIKRGFGRELIFSVHAPFGFGQKELGKSPCPSPLNLAFPNRKIFKPVISSVVSLADEIGAKIINIHAGAHISFRQRGLIEAKQVLGERRRIITERVKIALENIQKMGRIPRKICLENMPPNWSEERKADPRLNVYEICFVELADFLQVVNPQKNIFATVDTSHLAGFLDSSQLLMAIKSLGENLGHVHFNDIGTKFQPFSGPFVDGLIPGDGGIGERIFKELLQYFVEYSKKRDLALNIEVRSKNYQELNELRESVRRVMRWLEELS